GLMFLQPLPLIYVHKEDFAYEVNQILDRANLMFPIIKTNDGHIVTTLLDQPYVMTGWSVIEADSIDYRWIGSALAQFHRASASLMDEIQCPFSEVGTWPQLWEKKCDQLHAFQSVATAKIGTVDEDSF